MRIQNVCAALMLASTIGSPALADDFCVNLKTALAAAQTDFTNIPGLPDEFMPGWRDVTFLLPYATDCNVDTNPETISYFCTWQKEQSGALSARYHFTVQLVDQCLAGFQKTTRDRTTTWSNPAIGAVTSMVAW